MLSDTRVLVTAIVTAGVVLLALVVSLAYLAAQSRDASTILGLVSMLLSAGTLARTYALTGQVHQVREQVTQVREQTDGTTTKLIDHAISTSPSNPKE